MASKKRPNNGGSVYHDKTKGRWIAQVTAGYDQAGKQALKRVSCRTQAEATNKLNELLGMQVNGLLSVTKAVSLASFLDEWLKNVVAPKCQPKTVCYYEAFCRLHIVPALGKQDLRKIQPRQINALIAQKRKEGLSPETLRGLRATLRSAYTSAVRQGLAHDNPVSKTEPPSRAYKEPVYLSVDEVGRLVSAAEHSYICLLYTSPSPRDRTRSRMPSSA